MKRILIAAFDIDPTTGGESGMAWNFVNQVAMKHKVILITQQKHRRSVNAFLTAEAGVSRSNISVLGLDLHPLMHFLHGNALTEYFYYFIWQLRLPSAIVKSKVEFDVVHNLSMDKDWTPSFLYKLRKPFVWGPIGHKPQIPANYIKYVYGSETYLAERIKWIAKKILWKYNPFLNKTIQNADSILVMNNSVEEVLKLKGKSVKLMAGVGTAGEGRPKKKYNGPFRVISTGRFEPLSGFDIAIKSFANFYHRLPQSEKNNVSLLLIGEGGYKSYLQQITIDLHLEEVVAFEKSSSVELMRQRFSEHLLMLSPSHDMHMNTISEALVAGLPFICFENCGPGSFIDEQSGITLPYQNYRDTVLSFSDALRKLYIDRIKLKLLSEGAMSKFSIFFDGNANGSELFDLYENVGKEKD